MLVCSSCLIRGCVNIFHNKVTHLHFLLWKKHRYETKAQCLMDSFFGSWTRVYQIYLIHFRVCSLKCGCSYDHEFQQFYRYMFLVRLRTRGILTNIKRLHFGRFCENVSPRFYRSSRRRWCTLERRVGKVWLALAKKAKTFFGPNNNCFPGWCAVKFWPLP